MREAAAQARYTRIAVDAGGLSDDEATESRRHITAAAHAAGISESRLFDALGAIVERTGDFDAAFSIREELARFAQRSGAGGEAVGNVAFGAQQLGLAVSEIESAAAIAVGAQRVGAMTVRDIAEAGTPAIAAWAAAGQRGESAWRDLMASLQVSMQATGSRDLAVGTVVSFLADLQDRQSDIQAAGINTQASPLDIALELSKRPELAQEVLGRESIRFYESVTASIWGETWRTRRGT